MFDDNPNALFYLGLMGLSMLFSAGNLFVNAQYARSRGFSKWKNHLAPEILVFAANATLVWYAFSALPTAFESALREPVNGAFLILCIVPVFWFIASKGTLFLKEKTEKGSGVFS